MKSIGVRELRQRASEYLKEIELDLGPSLPPANDAPLPSGLLAKARTDER